MEKRKNGRVILALANQTIAVLPLFPLPFFPPLTLNFRWLSPMRRPLFFPLPAIFSLHVDLICQIGMAAESRMAWTFRPNFLFGKA